MNLDSTRVRLRLVLACILLMPLPSLATDETPNYTEDTLTGDWGGTRSAMFQKGLALDLGYKADLLRNLSGGIEKGGLKPGEARSSEPPPGQDAAPAAAEAGARIEKYAAGLWRYSAHVADLFDANPDGTPVNRPSWGWYALAEKTLYQADSDIACFVRISGTDGDSTAIKGAINVGFRAKAIVPGCGEDVFGLAYTRASLSSKWRSVQLALGTATSTLEDGWEATYRIQAGKWLAVQPMTQRINHPGGEASRSVAKIVGVRVEVAI